MSSESLLQDLSNGANNILISSISAAKIAWENDVHFFCLESADQKWPVMNMKLTLNESSGLKLWNVIWF